jgi:hypothetical protein
MRRKRRPIGDLHITLIFSDRIAAVAAYRECDYFRPLYVAAGEGEESERAAGRRIAVARLCLRYGSRHR